MRLLDQLLTTLRGAFLNPNCRGSFMYLRECTLVRRLPDPEPILVPAGWQLLGFWHFRPSIGI